MKFANIADPKTQGAIPQPDRKSVLLLVHLQNDFFPGGALAVPGGEEILSLANACIEFFGQQGLSIVLTRDWHSATHCSFTDQGGAWPTHCVQGSMGSQFHPELRLPPGTLIVSGATNPKQDAYSGFEGTTLEDRLEDVEAETLYVLGLAVDHWMKHTVVDACQRGFRVVVLEDGIRGVHDPKVIMDMKAAGAIIAQSKDIRGLHS